MFWSSDFFHDFLTIGVVVGPIAILPAFLATTASLDMAAQRRVALETVLIAFVLLIFFVCLGQIILTDLGIPLRTLEISGGILLFIFSIQRVIGKDGPVTGTEPGNLSNFQRAIYPLAVPDLAGPGAILTVILRTDNTKFDILEQAHTASAIGVVLAFAYLCLLFADPLTRLIGKGGANVSRRVMGMILAAYAVNLVMQGVSEWLHLPQP